MNFKDIVAADVNNAFINQDEFAEIVLINGEPMKIVRDDEIVNPPDTKMRMGNVGKQIAVYDVVFHVASDRFEHTPQSDMLMQFEDEEYRIKRVIENMGVLTIMLSRLDA